MSTVTFGYHIKDGTIEIDPVNGPRVQSIFRDYLNGDSLTDVALKNGFKFHGAVKRILINQTYLGDKYYPLLITPEIFNRPSWTSSTSSKLRTYKLTNTASEVLSPN